jgi:hypothetical protein
MAGTLLRPRSQIEHRAKVGVRHLALAAAFCIALSWVPAPTLAAGGASSVPTALDASLGAALAAGADDTPFIPRGAGGAGARASSAGERAAPLASPAPSLAAAAPGGPSGAPNVATAPAPTPWPWPSPLPTAPPAAQFRVTNFTLVRLAPGSRPYDADAAPKVDGVPKYHDANGVPMAMIGGRLVYKPAGLAQHAINALTGYRRTHDARYLTMAVEAAKAFVRIGRMSGGGLYIPYLFDFPMHSVQAYTIHSAWYSAMAQGQALSLFTRLYQVTGDAAYLATARQLFVSLRFLRQRVSPWVAWVDTSGYLWLEEYAQDQPEHTLNGFIFAMFGLYDYWLVTGDPTVLQELRGALTTLKANVMRYRNPGGPIDYCLKHGKPQLKYHHVVIAQLRLLATMTRDSYFTKVADLFAHDA